MSGRCKFNCVSALMLCLVLMCAVVGQCKVIYVKNSGDDYNDGLSWGQAKRSVQAGLDAATWYDQVWVAKGTYYERITLASEVGLYGGFAGNETKLASRNSSANTTILDGYDSGTVVYLKDAYGTVIDGFTIRNGSGTSDYEFNSTMGGGITCYSSSVTIANNVIMGNSAYCGAGIFFYHCDPTVTDNIITGNSAHVSGGIALDEFSGGEIARNSISQNSASESVGGIFCQYSYTTITNNTISHNSGEGIEFYEAYGPAPVVANNLIFGNNSGYHSGAAITIFSNSDPIITNNTIVANTAYDGAAVFSNNSHPSLDNNIIALNTGGIESFSSTISLDKNDVWGNTDYNYSGLSAGTHDSCVNPLFVSTAGEDYRLQGLSHCVDAGNDIDVRDEWWDLDSQPRIAGAHVDLGAYEYQGNALKITIAVPSESDTKNGPVTYTVVYTNAAWIALDKADVILNSTGTAKGIVSVAYATPTARIVTISNITGDGSLGISLAAGTAVDKNGVFDTGAGPSRQFAVSNTPPKVTISAPSVSSTSSGPVTYTLTYTGATYAYSPSVSLVKTGTASGWVSASGYGSSSRTVTISNVTGDGTIAISVSSGAAYNAAGSSAAAGPSQSVKVNNSTLAVSSFAPTSGAAGTTVTITGAAFTGVTSVRFNGVPATSISVKSATSISAVVPRTTTGKITVIKPGGTATSGAMFTFVAAPTITSFAPTSVGAGATVTISGTNLTGATAVKFNGTAATSFKVVSATSITAVVAKTTTGKISVTTPGGTATSGGIFTFVAAPTITSFTPASAAVGATVTINGTYLTGAAAVKFNGVAATSFRVVSSASITAVVPKTTSGKITVTTAGGTATSGATFTFIAAPTIASFAPASAGTGATVTISGTNLTGATAVKFNGVAATSFKVVISTSITAVVPKTTTGKITVTTAGGTATSGATFVFVAAPTITSFTPASAGAGATVTIKGTNFTGATSVKFNGVAATSFKVVSATSITAVVPKTTTGKLTVITAGGSATSAVSLTFVADRVGG